MSMTDSNVVYSSRFDRSKLTLKDRIHKMILFNLEIIHKQFLLCDVFNSDFSLVSKEVDEFAPLDLVVDLALDDYAHNQYELSLCLREILAVRFMNDYFVTPHKERSDLPVPFAKTYTKLLEAVMETVHAPWLEGGKEQFFKVLDRFYPDGGTDYFRKNFAQYFSAPLAASY